MARLDVYRRDGLSGYLMDCQSDMLVNLETRLTVPLSLFAEAPLPAGRLNPMFDLNGESVVMMTQYASAIRTSSLGVRVGNLNHEQDAVRDALDTLLVGY